MLSVIVARNIPILKTTIKIIAVEFIWQFIGPNWRRKYYTYVECYFLSNNFRWFYVDGICSLGSSDTT